MAKENPTVDIIINDEVEEQNEELQGDIVIEDDKKGKIVKGLKIVGVVGVAILLGLLGREIRKPKDHNEDYYNDQDTNEVIEVTTYDTIEEANEAAGN